MAGEFLGNVSRVPSWRFRAYHSTGLARFCLTMPHDRGIFVTGLPGPRLPSGIAEQRVSTLAGVTARRVVNRLTDYLTGERRGCRFGCGNSEGFRTREREA